MQTSTFARNRQELARLIYEMKNFTESELIDALKIRLEKSECLQIGGGQGISGYLKELWDLGYLDYQHGTYRILTR